MSESQAGGQAMKRWEARWYLWDGGFLTMGRSAELVSPHSHHAIQIAIGLDGPVGVREPDGEWLSEHGIAVLADVTHQFDPSGSLLGMIFVDPESREGRWLQRSLAAPISSIQVSRLDRAAPALESLWKEPVGAEETALLIQRIVRDLCVGPSPLYEVDRRILAALEFIRKMDTSRISLDEVARSVFLSPSRFAHLFSEQLGVPFRRYVLWRRLARAMFAVGRGGTLSSAAHRCGFSDSAHLTRACIQMFGLPPSVLLNAGEFYEIPSPFELPSSTG